MFSAHLSYEQIHPILGQVSELVSQHSGHSLVFSPKFPLIICIKIVSAGDLLVKPFAHDEGTTETVLWGWRFFPW